MERVAITSGDDRISHDLFLLPVASLWRREIVRFLRQRSRVAGALATPLLFWILLGSGLRDSFRMPGSGDGVRYLQYAFPGIVVLIVLFTAIFSTISIIEDRKEGFLQAVLAAPVKRSAIVVGKILGSMTLALIQGSLFLILAPLCGIGLSVVSVGSSILVLIVISVGLSALGVLIAWPMDSTQGFHAIMNLFLMPLWMLSGALFPASGASTWLASVMACNPLTYGVAALRHAMHISSPGAGGAAAALTATLPSASLSVAVSLAFGAVMMILAGLVVARRS